MLNRIAFDGLASGLPTSDLIESLMEIERLPVQRLQTKKSGLKEAQDAWRDINIRLSNLDGRLSALKLGATFHSRSVVSSADNVATATANRDAQEATYEVVVKQLATAHRIASAEGFPEGEITGGTIRMNGETVEIEDGASLKDIAAAINETEGVEVTASVIGGRLVLESVDTGEAAEIALADVDGGNVLFQLGFLDESGTTTTYEEIQSVQNAEVTINGLTIERASNTIDDAVEGVTFQLQEEGTTNIEIRQDVERVVKAVQEFVDQYNSTMGFIRTRLEYDADTGRSGVLQGDATLMRIEMSLRRAVTDLVGNDGDYKTASSIGISIDRYGVMSLDAAKLREAVLDDPDGVANLFRAEEDSEGFTGIAPRVEGYLKGLLQTNTGIIPERVDSFDRMIKSIDDQVESMERRLEKVEERYYRQFTAMEQALASLYAQQDWLLNQISALNSMGGQMNQR